MVLSTLLKFQASAITYVGNYTGPCLIQLNGEAIFIRLHTGVVINKWPYNCIRQFRAEDETGKFSFVSGRRGPYGVAEYNFSLPDESLGTLQNALTDFTGAQFSTVAPGSGADQQQQQPQPLPPHPSTHPRHTYSMSNAYQMSTPKHVRGGAHHDSVPSPSGDFRNSIFTSHIHSQQFPIPTPTTPSPAVSHPPVPKLPPRDYSLPSYPASPSLVSERNCPFSNSMDDAMLRSQRKERSLTAASSISRNSISSMTAGSHSMAPPTLPPKRVQDLPETWVAQGTNYEEISVPSQQSSKNDNLMRAASMDGGTRAPGIPQRTKLFDRLKGLSGPEAIPESEVKEETMDGPENVDITSLHVSESSLDVVNLSRSQLDQDKLVLNASGKDGPYDRLPWDKEAEELDLPISEVERAESLSGSISPDILPAIDWKKSPSYEDEEIDLPRSSPTVKIRSITPEHAQKIRRMAELGEGLHMRSLTTSRVSSDGSIASHAKLLKKSQTMKNRSKLANGHDSNNTYQVLRPLDPKHIAPGGKEEAESLYNVPRPSSAADLYKVPKGILASTLNEKRGSLTSNNETSLYNVPRSLEAVSGVEERHCKVDSKEGEGMYKIPSSILANSGAGESSSGSHPQGTSNVPLPRLRDSGSDGVYNIPRTNTGVVMGSSRDSVYNVPSPHYTKAQHIHSPSNSSLSPSATDNYKSNERQQQPGVGRMRGTKSFENLHKIRVKPSTTGGRNGRFSPPISKSRGVYEDIDADRCLTPAKNAPLPPLPTIGTLAPPPPVKVMEEGMYCEISDRTIVSNRLVQKASLTKQNTADDISPSNSGKYTPIRKLRAMTMSEYNEVKPFARAKLPDPPSSTSVQGLAKAKELSEEEGYEFCTPAPQYLRQELNEPRRTRSVWTPKLMGVESSRIIQNRSRPHSECTKVGVADPAVLGTSTPLDSGDLGDEYVIVTGPDRRLKLGSDLLVSSGVGTTDAVAEDEYEIMTSARVELILQRVQQQSCYSTPDPNLYGNCTPNETRLSLSSSSSLFGGRSVSEELTHSLPPRMSGAEEGEFAGINIDSMSPPDSDGQPVYFNVQHQRKSSSLSVSSRHSDSTEDGVGGGEGGTVGAVSEGMAMQTENMSALVKTMEGSPLDIHESAQLKNQTRSLANVLEEDNSSTPFLLHTSSTHRSRSPPSTSPSANKRHNYINYMPKDGEESNTSQETSPLTQTKKRPQPLPRSMLIRGESLPAETDLSS